jgi:uncharacterized RDD family membrane protein YckC
VTSTTRSRLLAGLIDLGLALAWALVVAAVGVPLYLTGQTSALGPLALNLVGLALVVLPLTVALTVMECGRYEATPGKLKFGLRVRRDPSGERVSWQRSLLRNVLKLGVPWSLGHLAAIALAGGGGIDAEIGAVVSMAVPVAYLVSLFIGDGRTIYDRLAGTMVISTEPGRRFA